MNMKLTNSRLMVCQGHIANIGDTEAAANSENAHARTSLAIYITSVNKGGPP